MACSRFWLKNKRFIPARRMPEAVADVRAIVLAGAGGFFSSGGNINALKDSANGTLSAVTSNTDLLNAMIRAIVDWPTPVIAAVE